MSESQNEKPRLFDASKEYEIKIFSGGEKACVVAFPTDAQWIARASKQRTIQHVLGRNKTRSQVINAEAADAELFAKIRKDQDSPKFSEAEASAVIARLERAQVTEVTREGDTFRIKMRVPGAVVEHVLKMPLREDVDACNDASLTVTSGRRNQELRVNIEPSAELYKKIAVSTTGYADPGAVPIIHKDAAVFEVIAQLRALEDEADDPEA